jgi:hypothetical protein
MSVIRPRALHPTGRASRAIDELASRARRLPPPVVASAALAGILGLAVLGQVHRYDSGSHWYLDNEDTLPALYSGALLAAAALLAFLVASRPSHRGARLFWIGSAALFAFMALDEVWMIHERVEGWTGSDWQLFYVPVAVVAGLLWLGTLRDLASIRAAAALFAAGGFAWLAAQVLEGLQWSGHTLVHGGLIVPEEVLEMGGSLMFLLAALVALRRETEWKPR